MQSRSMFRWLGLLLLPVFAKHVSAASNLTTPFNDLFTIVTIISILVAVFVIVLWVYFILKYREGTDAERKTLDHSFSRKLEIGWTLVAILIVIFLMLASYPYLISTIDNNEQNVLDIAGTDSAEKIVVEGTGSWQWRFHYNDTVAEPQKDAQGVSHTTLRLKTDKAYTFVLWSSGQLIHSFFIRELNFKQDVTPGHNNTFSVIITDPGHYDIVCAEFCGPGHSQMRGTLIVEAA